VADAPDVTRLLRDHAAGRPAAGGPLLAAIYDELRQIARARLRGERDHHTLSTTGLVHEAYLRLVDVTRVEWRDRAHFYGAAAGVMRRVLIDWARARTAEKRGGEAAALSLDALVQNGELPDGPPSPVPADDLLALDEALDTLARLSARQARVVECRFFAGLTIEETAEALGVSAKTVKQDWRLARTWLYAQIRPGPAAGESGDG
jgi:RNA polymerase sigma factor (TIGR02999 family)